MRAKREYLPGTGRLLRCECQTAGVKYARAGLFAPWLIVDYGICPGVLFTLYFNIDGLPGRTFMTPPCVPAAALLRAHLSTERRCATIR